MTRLYFEAQTGAALDAAAWERVLAYYTAHRGDFQRPANFCRDFLTGLQDVILARAGEG